MRRSVTVVRAGGIALVAGALAFLGVFTYLAIQFDYPAILDGTAAEVLPRLLATGGTGRAVWALYGFLPLIFVPAGVGAYYALRDGREGSMVVALLFALLAAIAATFAGLNSYLGNYLGEFLGELCFSIFFLLSALAMLAAGSRFPRWVGYFGVFSAALGLIGLFRNVTGVVSPVAEVNNYLLPLWMIIFGVALVRDDNRSMAFNDADNSLRHAPTS